MKAKPRRKSQDRRPQAVKLSPMSESTPRHVASPTAVAAEAMRTGVLPASRRRRDEGDTIRVGDPDDKSLANEYVGEETPGGTTPTPDQNSVDEMGRAYGLQDEDAGELHAAAEILGRRDRHRPELKPPRRPAV